MSAGSATGATGTVLAPGARIRAEVDEEAVRLLAERLYGISVQELTELPGYDDRNYRLTEDPNVKNPLILRHSPHGYVLKIMNSMDSKNLAVVEAQNELMNFLSRRSVTCPVPVRNVFGQLHSLETLGGQQHAVRLLEFVPGELLKDVPRSDALCYQLGEFVANLDNKLQNFTHSGLAGREHIWMLSQVPELEKFKYVIEDPDNLDLVEEVIEEFKYAVVPQLGDLERGVIHGDINEQNVLVDRKPQPSNSEYRIAGIIDFGDVQESYYVFELAIAMTYLMLLTGQPRSAGVLLAGYSVTRRLPDHEYRLLKTLVSARLVQSLVLGAYTLQQDPANTYVTCSARAGGWQLLRRLRKSPPQPDGDDTDWRAVADEYLTRS